LASEIAIEIVDGEAVEVEVEVIGGIITAVLEEVDSAAGLLCVSATLDSGSTEDEGGAPEPQSPKPAWQPTPQCSGALPHQPRELGHTCQQGRPTSRGTISFITYPQQKPSAQVMPDQEPQEPSYEMERPAIDAP